MQVIQGPFFFSFLQKKSCFLNKKKKKKGGQYMLLALTRTPARYHPFKLEDDKQHVRLAGG
jgi:hypothetical protein